MEHFLRLYERIARENWERPALSNFKGRTYTHREVVEEIVRHHLLYKMMDLQAGDHIGIASANCAQWAVTFLSTITYHAVAVPILSNFTPENITALTHHSDCKILYTDKKIFDKGIDIESLPQVRLVLDTQSGEILYARSKEYCDYYKNIHEHYALKYPNGVDASYLHLEKDDSEELVVINYTSGTTGAPKGIMLPARCFSANISYGHENIPVYPDDHALCMLPLAHMFGLTFEFLYTFLGGCHVFFLDKMPTPTLLMQAFKEVRPFIILTVPLVIEKILNGKVLPVLRKPGVRVLAAIPLLNRIVYRKIYSSMMDAFGGKIRSIILGGAAVNDATERLLHKIRLPYTIGYGMTECGPLIGYEHWSRFVAKSAGKIISPLQIRVDAPDPKRKVGELQIRGVNVMTGFYKNPEATKEAFTADGWMHTGDLGYVDKQGNIFIKGRSKCMILSANGQNIYPEEIEARLNLLSEVAESLVVARDTQLVGLIVLDQDTVASSATPKNYAADILSKINRQLPKFCQLHQIEILEKAFEHTPKGSIRRNLYH